MGPREIIRRNLEMSGPARLGMNFGGEWMNDFISGQIDSVDGRTRRRWVEGQYEYHQDEWGSTWHRVVGMSTGGEVCQPALADWSMLDDYRLPDLASPLRYERARQAFAADETRYRVGCLPGFTFSVCRYLRRMEVYFADLILERRRIDVLHERVTALLEEVFTRWAEVGADGIFFCEDWGVQDRLLIAPSMWRDIFKPLFWRLCCVAHEHGLHVLMHSCGYNWDILDDLAEVGIDCFQFDQPGLYDLERLAAKLRELHVCLWSPVDVQRVLPTGNRALIEGEAQRLLDLFSGHFIARNYGDLLGVGAKPEWDEWAYRVFERAALCASTTGAEPQYEQHRPSGHA